MAEGLLALARLILLQFAITWLSIRSTFVSRLVKAEPRLLYYRGEFVRQALRAERMTEAEVLQADTGALLSNVRPG